MVTKITIMEVIEPFLSRYNEKIHLSELAKILNKNHTSLRKNLNFLVKEKVLRKSKLGRMTFYQLNLKNTAIIDYLVIAEKDKLLKQMEKSSIFREFIEFIHKNSDENTKVLIFGSATEDFKSANDLDILVVGGKINFEKFIYKIAMDIHEINVKKFENISETLRKEIIKKHLIIRGSEEIIRWMIWKK